MKRTLLLTEDGAYEFIFEPHRVTGVLQVLQGQFRGNFMLLPIEAIYNDSEVGERINAVCPYTGYLLLHTTAVVSRETIDTPPPPQYLPWLRRAETLDRVAASHMGSPTGYVTEVETLREELQAAFAAASSSPSFTDAGPHWERFYKLAEQIRDLTGADPRLLVA